MLKIVIVLHCFAYVNAVLPFMQVGFNKAQVKTIDDSISHWNDGYSLLSLVQQSKNKIINSPVSGSGIAYTITKIYSNRNVHYDVVVDMTKTVDDNAFFNILLHEWGHVLGLFHSADVRSIMNISISLDTNLRTFSQSRRRLGLIDRCSVFNSTSL